jgi:hypothetical protein
MLSSATITADDTRARDLDLLLPLDLWITVRILENFEIELATTEKSGEDAAGSPEGNPAAERRELHINPVPLSVLPDVIHLTGRRGGPSHDDATARSYALTLTFSDGSPATYVWSTTFEVPPGPLATSPWHVAVPFDTATLLKEIPQEIE